MYFHTYEGVSKSSCTNAITFLKAIDIEMNFDGHIIGYNSNLHGIFLLSYVSVVQKLRGLQHFLPLLLSLTAPYCLS